MRQANQANVRFSTAVRMLRWSRDAVLKVTEVLIDGSLFGISFSTANDYAVRTEFHQFTAAKLFLN